MILLEEFLQRLDTILERPGMFGIQSVEDINIIFMSEVHINRNVLVEEWSRNFSDFLIEDSDFGLVNFSWCKIIRLYSGSDLHSIQLFKELHSKFRTAWSQKNK